jgi:type IV pilus assembly protein PilV
MTNNSDSITFIRKIQQQNGMTFIEVLIALVILVTGILGAVALQAVAKKSSFDSMQRSLASSLAQDIIERMRGGNSNLLNRYTVGSPFGAGGAGTQIDCAVLLPIGCTSAQVASNDLYEWEQTLIGSGTKNVTSNIGGLVNGVGCINVVGNRVSVTISWQGRTDVADGGNSATGNATCDVSGKGKKRRQVVVSAFIL